MNQFGHYWNVAGLGGSDKEQPFFIRCSAVEEKQRFGCVYQTKSPAISKKHSLGSPVVFSLFMFCIWFWSFGDGIILFQQGKWGMLTQKD